MPGELFAAFLDVRRIAGVRMVATARPVEPSPPHWRAGVYAFRSFDVRASDAAEFVDLSERAWPEFESGYDAQIIGLWRSLDVPAPEARFHLLTRYASLATWEASRADVGRPEFARRAKLTRATRVVTATLGVTRIRVAREADRDAIRAVHTAAFGRADEAELALRLWAREPACISLVAEADGAVVGHVLFSPVSVDGRSFERAPFGLGPVGVLPGLQRGGAGKALCRAGIDACRKAGAPFLVVLGHPPVLPALRLRARRPLRAHLRGRAAARRVHGARARARRARERRRPGPLRARVRLSRIAGESLMPMLKTPAEYVESLRDGRVVFWDGDKIEDVTKDAALPRADRGRRARLRVRRPGEARAHHLPDRGGRPRAPRVPDPAHRGGPAEAPRAGHADEHRRRRHRRVHGAAVGEGRGRAGQPALRREHREPVALRARERPARGRGHHRREGRPRAPRAPAGRPRPVPAHRRPQRQGHRGARREAAHHRGVARARARGHADQVDAPRGGRLRGLVLDPDQRARREDHQPQLRARRAARVRLPRERAPLDARGLRHLRRRVRAVGARVPGRRGPPRGRVRALARPVGAHARHGRGRRARRAHDRPGAARLGAPGQGRQGRRAERRRRDGLLRAADPHEPRLGVRATSRPRRRAWSTRTCWA